MLQCLFLPFETSDACSVFPCVSIVFSFLPCRVSIEVSRVKKHMLPVNSTCAFSHVRGIALSAKPNGGRQGTSACKPSDGTAVTTYDELRRCVHQANCDITDKKRIQMAIFRDPRPAVVSAFYHIEVHTEKDLGSLEAFIARELPILCQWLTVRHILFRGLIPGQSVSFWYNDAMTGALEWHQRWFDTVGLQLPASVVEAAAMAAAANDLGMRHKELDTHPSQDGNNGTTSVRRFEDEVGPEVVEAADAVLRLWLPPVILKKLGVEPRM